jgi:hypothetical protein
LNPHSSERLRPSTFREECQDNSAAKHAGEKRKREKQVNPDGQSSNPEPSRTCLQGCSSL